jgi:DNA-binding MarR family transcriptional regulator
MTWRVKALDTTLAFKAICLSPFLSGLDKRVLATILDHYNHATSQCDPSLRTIAELLGIHVRSVIRAVERAVGLGLFRKTRHGGNFHRNFYEPVWEQFRRIENEWSALRRDRKERLRRERESRLRGRNRQPDDDESANQTCPINSSNGTNHHKSEKSQQPPSPSGEAVGLGNRRRTRQSTFIPRLASSEQAKCDHAERRWNEDLTVEFRSQPEAYSNIVSAITPEIQVGATAAESKKRGAGIRFILDALRLPRRPS